MGETVAIDYTDILLSYSEKLDSLNLAINDLNGVAFDIHSKLHYLINQVYVITLGFLFVLVIYYLYRLVKAFY